MELLQSMRVFAKLAELGSFTKTADALQMRRPQVTVVIGQLEASMGVRLFQRTTRRVSLTPEGDAFLAKVHDILDRVANASAMFSRPGTVLRGRLRLDIPSAFAVQSFIAALHAFTQAHSGIELTLGVTDRAVDLVAESADCAIRLGDLADSSLVAKQLGFATMVTCAAPGYVAKFGAPESPDVLSGHALVGFISGVSKRVLPWNFTMHGKDVSHTSKGGMLVNDSTAYVECGVAGFGIIQAPGLLLDQQLASGRLVEVLAHCRPKAKQVSMLLPTRSYVAPHVRAFVEWMTRHFETIDARWLTGPEQLNKPKSAPLSRAKRLATS
ncbi:LysR family transcriptional regulator [Xanthomonas hortorum]|uniref:LysR family transcriptional regulator n=1 Tax=Xanthomonas hortorum TaxID=56454 RepID=UPI001594948A|nr:LysR family transcriptional regulator [Xanthomonas hortorum]